MSISQQPSPRGNGRPHVALKKCPCCGQEITTKEQIRKIQQWTEQQDRDRERKLQEELNRRAAKITADAEALGFKKGQAAKKDGEQKKIAELEREKKEALALAKTLKANREAEINKARSEERKAGDQRVAEKSKQITALNTKTRKLETAFEQLQRQQKTAAELADSAELDLLARLRAAFKDDDVKHIGTSRPGKEGADILEIVMHKGGACGQILIESKNHNDRFLNEWVTKLRKDKRDIDAEHAILSVLKFPKDAPQGVQFYVTEGIIVAKPEIVVALVDMLRDPMIKMAIMKLGSTERDRMNQRLYKYLSSKSGLQALRSVFETLAKLRGIDQAQEQADRKFANQRKEAYTEQEEVFGPLLAAIYEILGIEH
jgi:hypothetical protein